MRGLTILLMGAVLLNVLLEIRAKSIHHHKRQEMHHKKWKTQKGAKRFFTRVKVQKTLNNVTKVELNPMPKAKDLENQEDCKTTTNVTRIKWCQKWGYIPTGTTTGAEPPVPSTEPEVKPLTQDPTATLGDKSSEEIGADGNPMEETPQDGAPNLGAEKDANELIPAKVEQAPVVEKPDNNEKQKPEATDGQGVSKPGSEANDGQGGLQVEQPDNVEKPNGQITTPEPEATDGQGVSKPGSEANDGQGGLQVEQPDNVEKPNGQITTPGPEANDEQGVSQPGSEATDGQGDLQIEQPDNIEKPNDQITAPAPEQKQDPSQPAPMVQNLPGVVQPGAPATPAQIAAKEKEVVALQNDVLKKKAEYEASKLKLTASKEQFKAMHPGSKVLEQLKADLKKGKAAISANSKLEKEKIKGKKVAAPISTSRRG